MNNKKFLILTSWCHGLGASRLVESLQKDGARYPNFTFLSDPWNKTNIKRYERFIFNKTISRIYSIIRSHDFSEYESVLVMADIPYRIKGAKQYVYFHNPGILFKKSIKAKIARFLISKRKNCELIVQTEYIRNEIAKYFKGVIHVMLPPINSESVSNEKALFTYEKEYIYYPARNYKHKNIEWLVKSYKNKSLDLYVNLSFNEGSTYLNNKNIKGIGEVDEAINLSIILSASAIIISSSLESLCLPILEARHFGISLLVPKEDYAFALLNSDDAYFYDLFDVQSLNSTIETFFNDYKKGCQKIPSRYETKDWNQLFNLIMEQQK